MLPKENGAFPEIMLKQVSNCTEKDQEQGWGLGHLHKSLHFDLQGGSCANCSIFSPLGKIVISMNHVCICRFVDPQEPIDLLNVAFEQQQQTEKPSKAKKNHTPEEMYIIQFSLCT